MSFNRQTSVFNGNVIVWIFAIRFSCRNRISSYFFTGCSVKGNTFDGFSLYQSSLCDTVTKLRIHCSDMLRCILNLQLQGNLCNLKCLCVSPCRFRQYVIIIAKSGYRCCVLSGILRCSADGQTTIIISHKTSCCCRRCMFLTIINKTRLLIPRNSDCFGSNGSRCAALLTFLCQHIVLCIVSG